MMVIAGIMELEHLALNNPSPHQKWTAKAPDATPNGGHMSFCDPGTGGLPMMCFFLSETKKDVKSGGI